MKYLIRRTKTLSAGAVEFGTTVSLEQGDILELKLDLSESQQVSVMVRVAGFSESLEGTRVNSVVVQFLALKPEDHNRIETFLDQNTVSPSVRLQRKWGIWGSK